MKTPWPQIIAAMLSVLAGLAIWTVTRLADVPTRAELARGLEQAQMDAVQDTDRLFSMIQECCR